MCEQVDSKYSLCDLTNDRYLIYNTTIISLDSDFVCVKQGKETGDCEVRSVRLIDGTHVCKINETSEIFKPCEEFGFIDGIIPKELQEKKFLKIGSDHRYVGKYFSSSHEFREFSYVLDRKEKIFKEVNNKDMFLSRVAIVFNYLLLLSTVYAIFVIIPFHILRSKNITFFDKFGWSVAVLFIPVFGGIWYYIRNENYSKSTIVNRSIL